MPGKIHLTGKSASSLRPRKRKGATVELGVKADLFPAMCEAHGLPRPVTEYKFALESAERGWMFDYCWPGKKIALEVEGGVWKSGGGRHNRGQGFIDDMAKYNEAARLGYRLFRCITEEAN